MNIRDLLKDDFGIDVRIASGMGVRNDPFVLEPCSVEEAAWGIRTILDSRMADLLRRMTVERGYDPKAFALFANGGAGPSHAWALAADLGLDSFVVPAAATALSALGTAVSDFQFNTERATYVRVQGNRSIEPAEAALIERGLRDAAAEATTHLQSTARDEIDIGTFAAVRYLGQTHHLDVPIEPGTFAEAEFRKLIAAFQTQYSTLFGVSATYTKAGYEILSVRAVGTGKLNPPALASRGEEPRRGRNRRVIFSTADDVHDCALWQVNVPPEGWSIAGPAIVEFTGQSVVVPPGAHCSADHIGNLHVRLAP